MRDKAKKRDLQTFIGALFHYTGPNLVKWTSLWKISPSAGWLVVGVKADCLTGDLGLQGVALRGGPIEDGTPTNYKIFSANIMCNLPNAATHHNEPP